MPTQTQQDLTAINNYAGQYEKQIRLSVFNDLDIAKDLKLITNLTSPRDLPKYSANDGLRPYDSSIVDPDGQAGKFSKRTIKPRTAMKILRVIPEELRKTFLSEGLRAGAKDYPQGFAQYFWEEQTKKQRQEINNNSYNGVDVESINAFDAGTAYPVGQRFQYTNKSYYEVLTATTAGQTPDSNSAKFKKVNNSSIADGLGTIIKREYAGLPASRKIATGVMDATNSFDKVTNFYLGIPEEYRNLGGIIRCSRSTYDNYNMSALAKFTAGTSFLDVKNASGEIFGKSIIGSDGKWMLKPATWMAGSKRLIVDINENLFMGTDLTSDFTGVSKTVETIHGYDVKMQLILAFEIGDLELLFVNDQE